MPHSLTLSLTHSSVFQVRGGGNRLRSQYHRLGLRYHPGHFEPKRQGNATPVTAQRLAATLYFRRVAVAFVSLLDPDRAMVKEAWLCLVDILILSAFTR